MDLEKTLAVEALCRQIVALVAGEDDAFSYPVRSVRVDVASGTKAKAKGKFTGAMRTFLRAKQSAKDEKNMESAEDAFLHAVDEYAKEMGY
jgi:hypothetical protein